MLLGLAYVNSCSIHSNHPTQHSYSATSCHHVREKVYLVFIFYKYPSFRHSLVASDMYVFPSPKNVAGIHCDVWQTTSKRPSFPHHRPVPSSTSPVWTVWKNENVNRFNGREAKKPPPSLLTWNHAGKQEQRWVMKTRVVDLCAAIIPECVGDELKNETLLKIILALNR